MQPRQGNGNYNLLAWLTLGVLVVAGLALFPHTPNAAADDLATATFYVHCYDVGASALDGLPGIKKIRKGFDDGREVNTVHYDPSKITVEQMEQTLKKAHTYSGTKE